MNGATKGLSRFSQFHINRPLYRQKAGDARRQKSERATFLGRGGWPSIFSFVLDTLAQSSMMPLVFTPVLCLWLPLALEFQPENKADTRLAYERRDKGDFLG